MSPRMVLALVLAALVTAPPVAADDGSTVYLWRPLAAVAFDADAAVILSWAPGPVTADTYEIYGISEAGTTVHLATVPGGQTFVDAPPGYPGYGITAILSGVETSMVEAFDPKCVVVEVGVPPDVYVDECSSAV